MSQARDDRDSRRNRRGGRTLGRWTYPQNGVGAATSAYRAAARQWSHIARRNEQREGHHELITGSIKKSGRRGSIGERARIYRAGWRIYMH
jgi:hypothetical protein